MEVWREKLNNFVSLVQDLKNVADEYTKQVGQLGKEKERLETGIPVLKQELQQVMKDKEVYLSEFQRMISKERAEHERQKSEIKSMLTNATEKLADAELALTRARDKERVADNLNIEVSALKRQYESKISNYKTLVSQL